MGAFDKLMGKGGKAAESEDVEAKPASKGLLGGLVGGSKGGGGASPKKASKGKKKDGCSQIFEESVPEVVVEDFRDAKLTTTHDGKPVYLGMLLDTSTIGGFGRKSHKDEQKGSIIECVNQGRIKVLATPELLDSEMLVFVPQADTVDAMADFPLLTDADYMLVYVDDDCEVEDSGVNVSWATMRDVIVDHLSADDLLTQLGVDADSPADTGSLEPVVADVSDFEDADTSDFLSQATDAMPAVGAAAAAGATAAIADEADGTEVSFIDAAEDTEDAAEESPSISFVEEEVLLDEPEEEPVPPVASEVSVDETPQEMIVIDDSITPEDMDTAEAYDEDADNEVVVDDEVFTAAMTRHFYSDDLRLEVSTEAFDAQFLHLNAYVPFDTDRPAGWMNDYLNQYCRDANAEMKRLHNANLLKMREKFFNLLSMHAEKIQRDLDIANPDTIYGKQKEDEDARRQELMDEADRTINEKRAQIEAAFEARAKDAGVAAAQAAEQQYRDRYGRAHEDEMRNAEMVVREGINNDYHDRLREINEDRRAHASRRMDYGITETLHACSVEYMGLLEEEQVVYKRYREGISRFIDENRKDDIARAETLAEELRQSEKADAVMAEYTQKINTMSAEYDTKRRELLAEIDKQSSEYEATIERMKSTHESEIEALRTRNAELEAKLDSMRDDFATLDASKERSYQEKIDTLSNERDAWMAEVQTTRTMNRNRGIVTAGLALVAVIAAGAIGMSLGVQSNLDRVSDDATAAIVAEYNQKLAELSAQQTSDLEQTRKAAEAKAEADAKAQAAKSKTSSAATSSAADSAADTDTEEAE